MRWQMLWIFVDTLFSICGLTSNKAELVCVLFRIKASKVTFGAECRLRSMHNHRALLDVRCSCRSNGSLRDTEKELRFRTRAATHLRISLAAGLLDVAKRVRRS